MKTIRDIMTTDVVWVSPSARIKTAVILMKGHNIGALPVVHANDEVAGILTYQDVLGEPQDAAVMDVMTRDYVAIDPETSVYDAADVMVQTKSNYLLVMENEHLVGILSHGDILPELGKTFDPLTGLPWSDRFREWATAALKHGREISLVFFDLDKFGFFNKRYGHVVGDTVLREVAGVLKQGTDPDLDLVCRYGGDEFVVVSYRNADDAIAMAEALKESISRIHIPDVPEGVSGTYGLAGGRRTKEREDIHYAATIDDLVTRASKNATLNKPHKPETEAPAQTPAAAAMPEVAPAPLAIPAGRMPRLKIQGISYSSSGTDATVGVSLQLGDREFRREASGYLVEGNNMLRLVAEASAGAASKLLAPGHGVVVDEVLQQEGKKGEQIITVVAVFITPRFSTRCAGSAIIKRGDQFRAAAAAVLDAINRQFEVTPHSQPEEPVYTPPVIKSDEDSAPPYVTS